MGAINIPGEAENFLGENPQVVKVKKVVMGFDSGDVVVGADQGTYALFNVPAGTLVLDVLANVSEAWTALVTITVGDGTSAAGYFASADLAPQTAVTSGLLKRATASAEALANGKLYAAADTIDAVVAGANPDAGELVVYIVYIENASAL